MLGETLGPCDWKYRRPLCLEVLHVAGASRLLCLGMLQVDMRLEMLYAVAFAKYFGRRAWKSPNFTSPCAWKSSGLLQSQTS